MNPDLMNGNRDELLGLLKSIGVELPRKTKLPITELERRLSKVLDSCQYLSRVIPTLPFDPTPYPTWNKANRVLDAVRRHNFGEATVVHESKMNGVTDPFPLYQNAFMDLRQSMMSLGNVWDTNRDTVIFQDNEQESGVCMRILDVREFDTKTPIFIVVFRHDLKSAPSFESLEWISSRVRDGTAQTIFTVTATVQEQQLLLKLLEQNSKRFISSYRPKRATTERAFTLSFLLPVGPLGVKEMGTYNRNDGCSICGEPAKSKCSRCGAIRYCSPVCQKEDWKSHRPTCTSLMGGTWQNLTFTSADEPSPGVNSIRINRFTDASCADLKAQIEKTGAADLSQPPANTHGRTPFIVKVQLNSHLANGPGSPVIELLEGSRVDPKLDGTSMLIYDRQRTFEVHVSKAVGESDSEFELIAKVVKTQGMRGLKVFCWAVRSGEWTIDLCLDHLPEWQNW